MTQLEFRRDLRRQKTTALCYRKRRLRGPAFSRFVTVPACDRRTDGRTHDDSIFRASIASRGKTDKYLTTYSPSVMAFCCMTEIFNRRFVTNLLPSLKVEEIENRLASCEVTGRSTAVLFNATCWPVLCGVFRRHAVVVWSGISE